MFHLPNKAKVNEKSAKLIANCKTKCKGKCKTRMRIAKSTSKCKITDENIAEWEGRGDINRPTYKNNYLLE